MVDSEAANKSLFDMIFMPSFSGKLSEKSSKFTNKIANQNRQLHMM